MGRALKSDTEKSLRRDLTRTRRQLAQVKARRKARRSAEQRQGVANSLERFIVDAVREVTGEEI